MPYSLRRTRDGAGDSGQMSVALRRGESGIEEGGTRPKIGYAMRVGSYTARTYEAQDYWTTTYITGILEETETRVVFRTGNSEYVWEKF